MKRTLWIISSWICGFFYPLMAADTDLRLYEDSVLEVACSMPPTLVRLSYLRDMAYKYQHAPYNVFFATRLYEEACQQRNAFYENQGAYYLASYYDKKHDPDSLTYWVDILKSYAPKVGTYDYYLEQKAAIARALASKRKIAKAVLISKETLGESLQHRSSNGELASYNSLGCVYTVSSRPDEALSVLLKGYNAFTPNAKVSLKIDILSRITHLYGTAGNDSLNLKYVLEMDTLLQNVISQEPEARKNWTNYEVDCEFKYILYYMNCQNFVAVKKHIDKAKELLGEHLDPVYWLNLQLIQLQYYGRTNEYDKSIALIDEVAPIVLNNYVSTFATLIDYKATIQHDMGDLDGGIDTRMYLIRMQDSLDNTFSANQLQQVKEIYHIDEHLLKQQKIQGTNYSRGIMFLGILIILMFLFYLYTRYLSKEIAITEKLTAEAASQAEADNMAKERLKSEISHDIRTPLNVVVGFAELLTDPELDPEAKEEYGQIIQSNAENLLSYINSILELSRLESGKIKYQKLNCDVIHLCQQVLQRINSRENATVVAVMQTEIEEQWMEIDIKWFEALLTNLLAPMENDTEQYQVIVRVKLDKSKSQLLFDVVNTPLGKTHFENKTSSIRHEIHAHFVHYFRGIYKVQTEAIEGPTVSFALPL